MPTPNGLCVCHLMNNPIETTFNKIKARIQVTTTHNMDYLDVFRSFGVFGADGAGGLT